MGRLIDADKIYPDVMTKRGALAISQGQLAYAPAVEAIPKADYEARLRADLEAMLTELKLEIEEKAIELCDDGWWLTYNYIIQQKINALKGEVC